MKKILAATLVALGLASCATGVQMTDEEAAACRAEGCTVWTERELRSLADHAFGLGFQRGAQSRGRAL